MAKVMKVDPDALRRFLEAGHSQASAAKHFGVSEGAISQRVKALQIATSKVVALERAGDVVGHQVDANARLARVQRVIDDELVWVVEQIKGSRVDPTALQTIPAPPPASPSIDRSALQETMLKLAAEVRQQLALQLNITRTLYDLKFMREFQQSVVRVIAEESPEVARRIVARLKEQHALRRSAELPTLDGRDGFDLS